MGLDPPSRVVAGLRAGRAGRGVLRPRVPCGGSPFALVERHALRHFPVRGPGADPARMDRVEDERPRALKTSARAGAERPAPAFRFDSPRNAREDRCVRRAATARLDFATLGETAMVTNTRPMPRIPRLRIIEVLIA